MDGLCGASVVCHSGELHQPWWTSSPSMFRVSAAYKTVTSSLVNLLQVKGTYFTAMVLKLVYHGLCPRHRPIILCILLQHIANGVLERHTHHAMYTWPVASIVKAHTHVYICNNWRYVCMYVCIYCRFSHTHILETRH